MEYSTEQKTDIEERLTKASHALKELQLAPAAQMMLVNTGNDIFGIKVIPGLNDTKYSQPKEVVETPTEVEVIKDEPTETAA